MTASTPGNGPSPTAATNTSAYTSVSIERRKFSTARAGENSFGADTFRAATNPSGSAVIAATVVPSSAISNVRNAPSSADGNTSKSGGNMRRTKSTIHGSPRAKAIGSAPVSHARKPNTTSATNSPARFTAVRRRRRSRGPRPA
jgi:hypothetical protein